MKFDKEDENYIYQVISKNIKKYRKEKGWTQEKLANEINYSLSFIKGIEANHHQTFSLGALWRISRVLKIDFTKLCEDTDKETNIEENKNIKFYCDICNNECYIPEEIINIYEYIKKTNNIKKEIILNCTQPNCKGKLKKTI